MTDTVTFVRMFLGVRRQRKGMRRDTQRRGDRQTDGQRQTERDDDRQTEKDDDRQTDRQTGRQTERNRHISIYPYK